jgi:hypothetical protein
VGAARRDHRGVSHRGRGVSSLAEADRLPACLLRPPRPRDRAQAEKIGFGGHRKIVLPTNDGGRCLVEFRSADQDAQHVRAGQAHRRRGCDERLPEAIYNRLLPRIVDRNGWILYSDIPEQWWQFERLKEAKPEAGVYFQHFTMHDNAHNLPRGAIERRRAHDRGRAGSCASPASSW